MREDEREGPWGRFEFFNNFSGFILGLIDECYEVDEEGKEEDGEKVEKN